MNKKCCIVLLMPALLTVGCSGQLDPEAQPAMEQAPIGFSVTAPAATRSVAGTMTLDGTGANEVSLKDLGFGVFAAHTGLSRYGESDVSSDFMYNEQVSYDDAEGWQYSPQRYWPGGEGLTAETPRYVSFFAYAPYSDADFTTADQTANRYADYCISGFSSAHSFGDPWITYRLLPEDVDLSHQVDLLYAKRLDMTKPVADTKVQFQFVHALSCVGDTVSVGVSADPNSAVRKRLRDLYVAAVSPVSITLRITSVSITYTLTEKGRLVLWNKDGEPNWQPILSEAALITRTPELTATLPKTIYTYDGTHENLSDWTDTGHGVFFIPVESPDNAQVATITVGYQVEVTDQAGTMLKDGTGTVSLPLMSSAEYGKNMDIRVTLTDALE